MIQYTTPDPLKPDTIGAPAAQLDKSVSLETSSGGVIG